MMLSDFQAMRAHITGGLKHSGAIHVQTRSIPIGVSLKWQTTKQSRGNRIGAVWLAMNYMR